MFERPRHQQLAQALFALDGPLLPENHCLFRDGAALWRMMSPPLSLLRQAVAKAEQAYGKSILQDLEKAINRMQTRHGWLERGKQTLAMNFPKAQLWQKIRALHRVLP